MTSTNRDFEGLECSQMSLKLFAASYRLAASPPVFERYNMADQIRRASLSILLNIAEGYGRFHFLDKLKCFYYSRGSMCETLSIFICAKEAGYIDEEQLNWVRSVETEAEKALNGYVGFIRKQQQGRDEFGPRYISEEPEFYITGSEDPVTSHRSPVTGVLTDNSEIEMEET